MPPDILKIVKERKKGDRLVNVEWLTWDMCTCSYILNVNVEWLTWDMCTCSYILNVNVEWLWHETCIHAVTSLMLM